MLSGFSRFQKVIQKNIHNSSQSEDFVTNLKPKSSVPEAYFGITEGVRLGSYDAKALQKDLSNAESEASQWFSKPEKGKYFGWSALPLYSLHGEISVEGVDTNIKKREIDQCLPTKLLEYCPYIKKILAELPGRKYRVRFMKLQRGGHIGLHRDRDNEWNLSKKIRLHIPIITNPGVKFCINGRLMYMRIGELWYLNTSLPHEVWNDGESDRVHLVIDIANTEDTRRIIREMRDRYQEKEV